MDAPPVEPTPRCLDCESRLVGPFCAQCGMHARAADARSPQLLWEGFVEAFELDGRLTRTLPALFLRPGHLAAEYAAGRRRRWTSPPRLLTFGFLVGLGALQLAGATLVERATRDYGENLVTLEYGEVTVRFPIGSGAVAQTYDTQDLDPDILRRLVADPTSFASTVVELVLAWTPWVIVGGLVPASALWFEVVFRRMRFVDHLVLSVHLHVVALFGMALVAFVPPAWPGLLPILALWLGVALVRLHGDRRATRALAIVGTVLGWSAAAAGLALVTFSLAIIWAVQPAW